jgi:hypothetical protein
VAGGADDQRGSVAAGPAGLEDVKSKPSEINGLSLVVRDHGGGPDAIGFLTLAETYLRAAEKLIPDEKSFIPTVGSPESFLAGHALELLLKSFLLASGVQVDYLKRKIGHRVRKCLKKAEERGIGGIVLISPDLGNRPVLFLMNTQKSTLNISWVRADLSV